MKVNLLKRQFHESRVIHEIIFSKVNFVKRETILQYAYSAHSYNVSAFALIHTIVLYNNYKLHL